MLFGGRKPSVDEGKIQEFLTRGVAGLFPSVGFLEKELRSGRRLSLYLGIDPTGPTLHMGHLVTLRKLKLFQEMGHDVILLIGDFTGMIGDPTDKTATRTRLTHREVLQNAKLYKEQASKFISFSGKNPARLLYNSKWNNALNFEGVLELATHVTVDQMLKRDMFEKRMKEEKPIYLHEFLYPLIQGYDSVAMDVDGEIGGNDQTFNMLTGRTLMKQMKGKEKFVMATKLLVDPSGKKMGKTEGNIVMFTDTPEEMVGKVMSWSDEMIIPAFELCTGVSLSEIGEMKENMEKGSNPRDFKLRLAETLVADVYDSSKAGRAVESFIKTFRDGAVPADMPLIKIAKGKSIADALVPDHVSSKSELRRLLEAGAVEEMNGITFTRLEEEIEHTMVVRVGKKKFVRVTVY